MLPHACKCHKCPHCYSSICKGNPVRRSRKVSECWWCLKHKYLFLPKLSRRMRHGNSSASVMACQRCYTNGFLLLKHLHILGLGPLAMSATGGFSSHNDKLCNINCKQVLKRPRILRGWIYTTGPDVQCCLLFVACCCLISTFKSSICNLHWQMLKLCFYLKARRMRRGDFISRRRPTDVYNILPWTQAKTET